MKLIDTHAHLDHIQNLPQALIHAQSAGVEGIISVSTNEESCRQNLEIKKKAQGELKIYAALGMHPSDADSQRLEACIELIRDRRQDIAAIGEIGLDFWYKWVRKDSQKKDEQRAVFRALLAVAKELDLPAVVHTRGTWRECLETVKEAGVKRAEFHWYSGPLDVLRDILDNGYYVSAAPSLAYSPPSREAIGYAPIERTMIETDSPVFYHQANGDSSEDGDNGFQAEPKDVFRTLEAYCRLKNIDEDHAADILNRNARDFFGLKND